MLSSSILFTADSLPFKDICFQQLANTARRRRTGFAPIQKLFSPVCDAPGGHLELFPVPRLVGVADDDLAPVSRRHRQHLPGVNVIRLSSFVT